MVLVVIFYYNKSRSSGNPQKVLFPVREPVTNALVYRQYIDLLHLRQAWLFQVSCWSLDTSKALSIIIQRLKLISFSISQYTWSASNGFLESTLWKAPCITIQQLHLFAAEIATTIISLSATVSEPETVIVKCMHLSHLMRKPTIWVSERVRHKPGCTNTEDG